MRGARNIAIGAGAVALLAWLLWPRFGAGGGAGGGSPVPVRPIVRPYFVFEFDQRPTGSVFWRGTLALPDGTSVAVGGAAFWMLTSDLAGFLATPAFDAVSDLFIIRPLSLTGNDALRESVKEEIDRSIRHVGKRPRWVERWEVY